MTGLMKTYALLAPIYALGAFFSVAHAETPSYPPPDPLGDADFHAVDAGQARIGQLLFHDKILSGNRNIACSTCHSVALHGADGLSLGIGEGGTGLGPERKPGDIRKRIPRNSPSLWNLGAIEVDTLFHDGRLQSSDIYGNGFDTPAEEWLPRGLVTPLAAQALFPLTAQFEMAGNPSENEIAGAVHDRIDAAWPILAKRVRTIPAYAALFVKHFDHVKTGEDVSIVEIGNALGAYIALEWRNHDSPFDAYLAGDDTALTGPQKQGFDLFYGRAKCAACHSGPLLSDQQFHALAVPQFGPGRTRRFDPYPRDVGRMGKSDRTEDAYRFRTPGLRNVALTAPYGHNGAFATLEQVLNHHNNPLDSLDSWKLEDARLPPIARLAAADSAAATDRFEAARHRAALDLMPMGLNQSDLAALQAFLHALTGKTAARRPLGRPDTVPSGLPVD